MAKTLLFIHGTGVRTASFAATMNLIRRKTAEYRGDYRVEGCQWGEAFGARLNLQGASVPGYSPQGNSSSVLATADQSRWVLLAGDPLLELRIAPPEDFIGVPPGEQIWALVSALFDDALIAAQLYEWDLGEAWISFKDVILIDPAWRNVICSLKLPPQLVSDKLARAIVAAFQVELRQAALPGFNRQRRDELVALLLTALGGAGLGVTDWLLERLTSMGVQRRGSLTDATSAAVGDVLRYQARGETLRNFIGEEVNRTGARVLLAHSLGGVAAVDWLAIAPRPIDALITVGSQASFLYEIDALCSRPFMSGLPDFFPRKWLNIYDERDFLSYQAASVFKGIAKDIRAENGQPFPESHSAYWHNDEDVWQPIASFLP
jgi:hypothetical protein